MPSFSHLLTNLDSDAHVRGEQFEHICKWFLENEPGYATQLKRVWLWNDWPDAWGADAGIDLVAEAANGDLWAIQAKAYSDVRSVTKRDVDTFLSESSRPQFAFRLLIATTNEIGRNAERTLTDQEKPVGRVLRSDLERFELDWPRSPADLRPAKPNTKNPRPHQQDAIEAVLTGFEEHGRGRLIMACGTGKTLVGLWVAEALESERILVLLPSLSLLAQTLREWTANAKRPFVFLPVCSDETVRGADHFVSNTSELGFPVTTDPAQIAAFMDADGPSVVFSTYQSSPRIAEAMERSGALFDFAIADEAHRCAGPVSSDFATILDDGAIRVERRLFQTATPRYFTDRVRKVAGEAEYEIASMDDEAHFGPEFHCLSFGEAIERDLLSDYQVVIVGVDDPTYREYVERGTAVTRDGKEITDARHLASQIALAKAMRNYDLRRTISFHSRVKRAREFAHEFPDVVAWMPEDERLEGELWCDHVSGKMPSGQRDRRLKRLRGLNQSERGLLTNARCLGEGVDIPTLDGVAFIDPRASQVDIIQAVGRAIRKAQDKKVGTVVLPVFVEDFDDPDEVLRSSSFKPVWGVLKALRAHDEQLADELDSIRREAGTLGCAPASIPVKVRLDLPATVRIDFVAAFETMLVEQATERWEFWYGLLTTFVEREGHAWVPKEHVERGWALGQWVGTQRRSHWRDALSPDRRERLESLAGWVWDAAAAQWERSFDELVAVVDRSGNARVRRGTISGRIDVGSWVSVQRRLNNQGKLSPSRKRRLQALPGWIWDTAEESWAAGYECLLRYLADHGNSLIPQSYKTDSGFRLGSWVATQRQAYRDGKLREDRVRALESLDTWLWSLEEGKWVECFDRLGTYATEVGHSRVPTEYRSEDGFGLGTWVRSQRQRRKSGTLAPDRVKKLEALPGWAWDRYEADWTDGYSMLEEYTAENGTSLVGTTFHYKGFRLGQWVSVQRREYGKDNLPPEKVVCLEALPGWRWNAWNAAWDDGYERLKGFVRREGHARVPAGHKEGSFRLGNWVSNRRKDRKAGKLTPTQIARLEALSGWTWDARMKHDD